MPHDAIHAASHGSGGADPVSGLATFGFPITAMPASPISVISVGTANHCWFIRILAGGGTITKIGLHVGAQSGNLSVAAYPNSGSGRGSVPGTQLGTSGAVACPAPGYQEIALGGAVTVGLGDWLALSCDNTTATFWNAVSAGGGSNLWTGMVGFIASSHPAPTTPGTPSWSNLRVPILIGIP